MEIHIDYGVSPNCVNPDSYGEICVRCGQCGRKFGGQELSENDRAVIERHLAEMKVKEG